MLSDPAVPGSDEDAAGVLGEVAVLLDGAGVPGRFRAGCHHSVSWFSHVLAAHLLGRAQDPTVPLRAALAAAIEDVRALHQSTCDLEQGGPSATVVVVRCTEEQLEHLVLCDSSLLLHGGKGDVVRVTDTRIDEVVRSERTAEAIEARRNTPGGFWVARHEPEAADEAIVGATPLARWERAHLVSDGITRAVDLLGLHDDASLAASLTRDPQALLRQLRTAEDAMPQARRPRKLHDDATVLTLRLARSTPLLTGPLLTGPRG
ncbi:protein phosphatase 2C domain-containing protein [Brachybacterium paraconglomeratum]